MPPKAAAAVILSPRKKSPFRAPRRLLLAALLGITSFFPLYSPAEEPPRSHAGHQAEFNRFLNLQSDEYRSMALKTIVNRGVNTYLYQFPLEGVKDPNLGIRTPKSTQVRAILRTDNKIIFDVVYSFDRYGRRSSPVEKAAGRDKFLILMGCSFTYGYGLNDNQTLNYYLGRELPDYAPYNYGIGATGPNTALAITEENQFRDQIPQAKGVMVYVSLGESHMDRATGRLPSLAWALTTPYYEADGREVRRNGSFATGRPITNKIYFFIGRILQFFGLGHRVFPPLNAADSEYMCLLVKKLRDTFQNQYPGSRFIYYLHPYLFQPDQLGECLTTHGIEWLRGRRSPAVLESSIELDDHPGARANQAIAAEIAEYLRRTTPDISSRNH
jgi:hypothetical protein